MNRIKSFLAVLALVSAVTVNAGATDLSVSAASGSLYGGSSSIVYSYDRYGGVTIPATTNWQINLPIASNQAGYGYGYYVGGVWSTALFSAAYVYTSAQGFVTSVSLNSNADTSIYLYGTNQQMFIRVTASSNGTTIMSARVHN